VRVKLWLQIAAEFRGVTPRDRETLGKTVRAGLANAGRDLDHWRTPMTAEDVTVVTRHGRFVVRGDTDDLIHLGAGETGAHIIACIARFLEPGGVFVDAGANIGFFSVVAARHVGPEGRVYAVEMMPETAAHAQRHATMNDLPQIRLVRLALSDEGGERVRATVPDRLWGQASIARDHAQGGGRVVEVETTTLDAVLADESAIGLIKMDLEGAELTALKGARETLKKTRAVVYERQPDPKAEAELVALFTAAGFRVRALDPMNALAERV
jgi:FkbM family methyltransferase